MPNPSTNVDEERLLGFQPLCLALPRVHVKPGRHALALNSHELVKVSKALGLALQPGKGMEVSIISLLKGSMHRVGNILIIILGKEIRKNLHDRTHGVKAIDYGKNGIGVVVSKESLLMINATLDSSYS